LRKIIVFDPKDSMPGDVLSFSSVCETGKALLGKDPEFVRKRSKDVKPEDVFTLVYTSGTTGEPKGVMLTHHNLISNIESVMLIFNFSTNDCTLSFLPLSHVFERMAGFYTTLYAGCSIAYAESIDTLAKNLAEVKPTVFMSVPRVYEKFYSRIIDNVAASQGFKKTLAQWALRVASKHTERKLAKQSSGLLLAVQYAIADRLVFAKIRRLLGGRLRLLISGGGALPKQLGVFFYGIGLTILEGYGLTETSPVISCNRPDNFKFGTVGPPISGVEVKIADDGEILTRGPHIMKGYYNKPDATAETLASDGWFRTGDIGEIDSEGFLRITDRKKDLIVTSSGKNIAPQFVENTLKTSRYITQIVIVGDKRNFPSALIVPNLENLKKCAAAKGVADSELMTHPAILQEIQSDIDRLSKDLASFERVKKIALVPHEFTIESGEMTPSLKIKRGVVEKKYKQLIDSLYS
jgi:long-chain acyl-CoA synthetase